MKVNPAVSSIQTNSTQESASAQKNNSIKKTGYEKSANTEALQKNNSSANTEISTRAREMAKATQIAKDTSDVRESKIAELKAKIANKQYDVSAEQIADRLVDDHLSMPGV